MVPQISLSMDKAIEVLRKAGYTVEIDDDGWYSIRRQGKEELFTDTQFQVILYAVEIYQLWGDTA